MALTANSGFLLAVGVVLLFIATPAAAFGAGDIVDVAKIDGINYRHGDIENTLLELIILAGSKTKFEKLDVKRVYFGNWLRDYSQAIDVGGLKQLPAETIRVLLWALSFLTFGYATGEFEVTAERLGCYRPEEHIDNPKDYADNEDARQYDQRLRGPVDEALELKVDPATGLKTYIASEGAGCETSAGMVRRLLEKSIELGRKHKSDGDKAAFYEALRLLGTSLHCLEDFAAHSNYTELALKELGVDAFPHVGKQTEIDVNGKKIFPLVTGTFGMTDFLASLVGELGDKVAQSEVEDMESKLDNATAEDEKNDQVSVLKGILDNVPWDMLGGDKPDPAKAEELKKAAAAKAEADKANPPDPNAQIGGINIEQAKQTAQETLKAMYPILEFNDQINKGVSQLVSKVPGLDDLLENLGGALQIFTFSLLAPYLKPIIAHARVELKSSSQGVLKSSEAGQYEVFTNETSSDPTHSMLSKDHFSNVLNPVAGQIACASVRFVVPQIVEAWSDGGKDVRQVIDNILQIFHHPALRDENREGQKAMFDTVKTWWESKSEEEKQKLSAGLSFDGVKAGNNHEGEGAEGGHGGHSHGAQPKKKNSEEQSGAPTAQEGASAISEIAGGLGGMFLSKTGLGEKLGIGKSQPTKKSDNSSYGGGSSYGQSNTSHSRPTEESSYGQSETKKYGGNDNSSYGGGRKNESEETSYGSGGYGQSNEGQTSSHGRKQQSGYGQSENTQEDSYGSSGRKKTEESSYGSSRRNDNEEDSYGSSGRKNTQESSYGSGGNTSYGGSGDSEETSGYGTKKSSYGSGGNTSYGGSGDAEETSGYGTKKSSYGRDDAKEESSNYGTKKSSHGSGGNRYGASDDTEETSSSNYGSSGRRQQESSYGSSGNTYGGSGDSEETSGYGAKKSSYGGGGGNSYGEEETSSSNYGRQQTSSRRNNNDDEEEETSSSRRGGNSSYGRGGNDEDGSERRGQGGYGRRGGNEDENSGY